MKPGAVDIRLELAKKPDPKPVHKKQCLPCCYTRC